MNVVGRCDLVQYAKAIPFTCLEQPVLPKQAVAFELEQKVLIVTAVCKMNRPTPNESLCKEGQENIPNLF